MYVGPAPPNRTLRRARWKDWERPDADRGQRLAVEAWVVAPFRSRGASAPRRHPRPRRPRRGVRLLGSSGRQRYASRDRAGQPRRQRRGTELHHRRRRSLRGGRRQRARLLGGATALDRARQPRRHGCGSELHPAAEEQSPGLRGGRRRRARLLGRGGRVREPRQSIARANLDGSGVEGNFIDGFGGCGLAVDGAHVYWSNPRGVGAGGQAHRAREPRRHGRGPELHPRRAPTSFSTIRAEWRSTGSTSTGPGSTLFSRGRVHRARQPRRHRRRPELHPLPTGLRPSCGVAVDGAHIYWGVGAQVWRAPTSTAANVDHNFIPLDSSTCGVAVDATFLATHRHHNRPQTSSASAR